MHLLATEDTEKPGKTVKSKSKNQPCERAAARANVVHPHRSETRSELQAMPHSQIGPVRAQALGGKAYLESDAIPRFEFGELRGWRGLAATV